MSCWQAALGPLVLEVQKPVLEPREKKSVICSGDMPLFILGFLHLLLRKVSYLQSSCTVPGCSGTILESHVRLGLAVLQNHMLMGRAPCLTMQVFEERSKVYPSS